MAHILRSDMPHIKFGELARLKSKRWKDMNNEERKKHADLGEEDKKRHKQELENITWTKQNYGSSKNIID